MSEQLRQQLTGSLAVEQAKSNLAIWNSLERTDPKHVKEITGKAYKGNSPRPHWVIWKLTERFGPVGIGFGWTVVMDRYVDGIAHPDGTEKLHELRILFWAGDSERGIDSYGATKALYKGRNGWVSDEDAAKKSLTDAITKAASWLGVAADIFMGRWDDSKYVAELKQEAANSRPAPAAPRSAPERPATPPHDPETGEISQRHNHSSAISQTWEDGIRDGLPEGHTRRQYLAACAARMCEEFLGYKTVDGLMGYWTKHESNLEELQLEATDLFDTCMVAYNAAQNALAAAGPAKRLTQAEGLRIVQTIGLCDSIDAVREYVASLEPHARNHAKIKDAAAARELALSGSFNG